MASRIVIAFNFSDIVKEKFGKEHAFKKVTVWGSLKDPEDFIVAGATAQIVMRIKYLNREGRMIYRWIEPYSYRFENKKRYLYALCRFHNHIHKWIPKNIVQVTFSETGLRYSNPQKIPVEIAKRAWVGTSQEAKDLSSMIKAEGG